MIFLPHNSIIPCQCPIGKGFFFFGGIRTVLHPGLVIGERVLIGQRSAFGGTFGSCPPRVENDVGIGPGVTILGKVTIGSNTLIGANGGVAKEVAENSIEGSVPAKLIKTIPPWALNVWRGDFGMSKDYGAPGK